MRRLVRKSTLIPEPRGGQNFSLDLHCGHSVMVWNRRDSPRRTWCEYCAREEWQRIEKSANPRKGTQRMKTLGIIVASIGAVIVLIVLAFVLELGGLQWKRFFAPKHEAVRREVFKQTRSYNESKTQDLARFRLQYMRGSAEDKAALAATIRTMFADYDRNLLPNELSDFLYQIRGY